MITKKSLSIFVEQNYFLRNFSLSKTFVLLNYTVNERYYIYTL